MFFLYPFHEPKKTKKLWRKRNMPKSKNKATPANAAEPKKPFRLPVKRPKVKRGK